MSYYAAQNTYDRVPTQTKQSEGAPISISKVLQAFRKDAEKMTGIHDEALQMKPAIQLQSEDEDEALQMKSAIQLQSEEKPFQGKFEPIQKKSNDTGLPDNLKSGVESMSGFSMDDVKVHYNSDKPAPMQAHAYTQGTDIHVASGQEKHLAHEAWHVVQQKQGRVQPTMQLQGVNVNDDKGLEHEADMMGARAVHIVQMQSSISTPSPVNSNKIVQLHLGKRPEEDGSVCTCEASVKGLKAGTSGEFTANGSGGNSGDSEDKGEIVAIINSAGLRITSAPENGNPHGQCAEPHAVADALDLGGVKSSDHITGIEVTEARSTGRFTWGRKLRCETCKQWVPETTVKPEYLQPSEETASSPPRT